MNAEAVPRALVVDDNFFNRDLCALVLNRTGYRVEQAENGREALEALQRQPYHLLVLDLAMPVMDGITLMRELRSAGLDALPHIIVMTANPHMVYHSEFDVDQVMYKPIDIVAFEQIAARLRTTAASAAD